MKPIFLFLGLVLCFLSCSEDAVLPKPRAYPRVVFPTRGYALHQSAYCPFSFEKPLYASVQQDTLFFDKKPAHPCWFDVYFPDFDARLHCSYYQISKADPLAKLKADAFEMANKHNVKAEFIEELPLRRPDGTNGFVFNIEGPVASSFQFYVTDSTSHFLRGALYFNAKINPDSLAPVLDFLKTDVLQMLNTLTWK